MAYSRDAFKCWKCPEKQEGGCPSWAELVMRNTATQEEKVTKGCVLSLMPQLLMYAEHSSNRVAGEVSAMRDAVAEGAKGLVVAAANAAIQAGSEHITEQLGEGGHAV